MVVVKEEEEGVEGPHIKTLAGKYYHEYVSLR